MKEIKIYELNRFNDHRGWFLKLLNGTESFHDELIGDVYFVCGKEKGVRGNHYHIKTDEWFSVISGTCKLFLEDINTKESIVFDLDESTPRMIHVPANIAHAFVNADGAEFIVAAFTNTIFDKEDTIPYIVVQS